jgi:hypothetical protein
VDNQQDDLIKQDFKLPTSSFKTIVLIPIEPAPADPSWIIKKHARRKFNPLEAEEYYKYEFEEEYRRLIIDVQNATNDAMKVDKRKTQNLNHINQWLNVP